MYRYLHYEHLPKDKLLARKIKSNKNGYIVDNELIYHLWNKRLNRHIYKQLCIPRELRPKILSLLRNTIRNPIRNTQCTFSNYSCGFIKVSYTVKRQQFHSSHYRRVFKICYHKSNQEENGVYSYQSNL